MSFAAFAFGLMGVLAGGLAIAAGVREPDIGSHELMVIVSAPFTVGGLIGLFASA